ncbi:MAG: sialidase family protein [Actinomycetota bacterium]
MTAFRTKHLLALLTITGLLASALGSGGGAIAAAKSKNAAGPKAVAHTAGGKKASGKPGDAPRPKQFRLGVASTEPTLGVANDGSVFTSAISTNTRVDVLRSKDRGKTWDNVSPNIAGQNTHLISLDPYTYVDNRVSDKDASRIFTVDLTVACSILSYSDDLGESWTNNPLACGRPVNDHQTLFAGPPQSSAPIGYDNIVYYCWNDVASSACSKSLDGGITFSPTGSPAFEGVDPQNEGARLCGGLHGHGFVDLEGNVYLPRGYCGKQKVAISRDEGRTWERHAVDDGLGDSDAGADPSVTVDAEGNIYYLFVGNDRLPYLTISKNDGQKWSKPVMVGAPGVNEGNLPAIDVGDPGKIAMVYIGTDNGPNRPVRGQSCRDSEKGCPTNEDYRTATWNAYVTVSYNALSKKPLFYSASINDPKDPIVRGRCLSRCTGRIPGNLDFIDLVVDPFGQVWTSFVDECLIICPQGGGNDGGEGIIGTLVGGKRLSRSR